MDQIDENRLKKVRSIKVDQYLYNKFASESVCLSVCLFVRYMELRNLLTDLYVYIIWAMIKADWGRKKSENRKKTPEKSKFQTFEILKM